MGCCNCDNTVPPSTCQNPCQVSDVNTAACESLPSQISNFTEAFFGDVVKTEVDGEVSWTLPCNLEVGLQNNPRIDGEGLACYFLRLFNDGILGATGPQGDPGEDGADGKNAFTVTLASFLQPTLEAPTVQISTSYNAAILPGLFVFIATSGFYEVTAVDNTGTVWLTLTEPLDSAPATITAGKLVVPAGHPGQSIVGPQGPAGAPGEQGPPGESFTATNEFYYATAGTDYRIQGPLADRVTFVNSRPEVTVDAGVWLITCDVEVDPDPTILTTDLVTLHLRDVTAGADLNGSTRRIQGMTPDTLANVSMTVRFNSPADGTTVALYAKMTTPNGAWIPVAGAVITAVKLS